MHIKFVGIMTTEFLKHYNDIHHCSLLAIKDQLLNLSTCS